MNTVIVNLYAASGSGKSTLAAELFVALKKQGRNVELVTEYVKAWAWQDIGIRGWADAIYISGKQLRRESILYGKVDVIITDSPLGLGMCYEHFYRPGENVCAKFYEAIRHQQASEGVVTNLDFHLMRSHAYVPAGRYETEDQARQVDRLIRQMIPGQNVTGIEDILLHPLVKKS